MRENESEGEYVSPWAPRDADEADQASGIWAHAARPPGDGDQDTIAYGVPGGEAGDYGQGSYVQRGRDDLWYGTGGDRAGSGARGDYEGYPDLPWYGGGPAESGDQAGYQGDPDQAGYRQSGYDQGGYRQGGYDQGGYGFGGYGQGGYGGGYEAAEPGRPPRRPGRFVVYIAVAALAAGIGAGITVAVDSHNAGSAPSISSRDVPVPHDNAAGSGSSSRLNRSSVVAKVVPGLVDISATLKYASETAEGTGMVINPNGLVLTNNHVIDGATSVTATLAEGGRQFQAQVIGWDNVDDVALLQLTGASGLATVSFGNSSQVNIGTSVLALGNAEGRGGATAAAGIIDGLNRSIQAGDEGSGTTENLNHMLQTNAQIQQGDSGGALANNAGQVIGMVTAANTGSGGPQAGTSGFAIPINGALAIARQIAARRASSSVYIGLPGFLGVEVAKSNSPSPQQQAADQQQANGRGDQSRPGDNGSACVTGGQQPGAPHSIAPAGTGALVLGVVCGTAAQAGGLVPGDVITSVDGQAVTTPGSLTDITSRYHSRQVVSIVWQSTDGGQHTLRFKLGDGPAR